MQEDEPVLWFPITTGMKFRVLILTCKAPAFRLSPQPSVYPRHSQAHRGNVTGPSVHIGPLDTERAVLLKSIPFLCGELFPDGC